MRSDGRRAREIYMDEVAAPPVPRLLSVALMIIEKVIADRTVLAATKFVKAHSRKA